MCTYLIYYLILGLFEIFPVITKLERLLDNFIKNTAAMDFKCYIILLINNNVLTSSRLFPLHPFLYKCDFQFFECP